MRFIFFSFIYLTNCITTYSQGTEDKLERFIKGRNIDSFLVYSFSCGNEFIPVDSCKEDIVRLLIWKQDENYFIKRFERCKNYNHLELDRINPFSYYLNNKPLIDTEEIKPPMYYEYKKQKGKKTTIEVTAAVSHSCYYFLDLSTGSTARNKKINTYDFEFTKFENGKENINNAYNNSTKLKQLVLKTRTLINLTEFTMID